MIFSELRLCKIIGNLYIIQRLFREKGGVLLEYHKVTEIQPGEIITVVTNMGTFKTRKLVLTAGTWTQGLTRALQLELPFKVF